MDTVGNLLGSSYTEEQEKSKLNTHPDASRGRVPCLGPVRVRKGEKTAELLIGQVLVNLPAIEDPLNLGAQRVG